MASEEALGDEGERVALFVDGSNLSAAAYEYGVRIDFEKLVHELVGERSLTEPYYFDSVRDENRRKKSPFHHYLSSIGYIVYALPFDIQVSANRWEQKGVDVALAMKMGILAAQDSYDTAILVAGDVDYFPALLELKDLGRSVEVAFFPDSMSSMFKGAVVDRFVDLESLADDIKPGD